MATTIGQLTVEMTLDSTKLRRDFQSAGQVVEQGTRSVGTSVDRFSGTIAKSSTEISRLASATRVAIQPLARELGPAFNDIAASAGGAISAARALGGRLGLVAAGAILATSALAKYAASAKYAGEFQADLNLAASAFRGDAIRSQLEGSIRERAHFRENLARGGAGAVTALGAEAFRRLTGGESFDVMISKSQTALREVLPLEKLQIQAEDERRILQVKQAQVAVDLQRANTLEGINSLTEQNLILIDREFNAEVRIARLEALKELSRPGILPEEGETIRESTRSTETAALIRAGARKDALKESRATAALAIINRPPPDLIGEDSLAFRSGRLPEDSLIPATDPANTELQDLRQNLRDISVQAQVFGRSFDEPTAKLDATRESMVNLIRLGLDPADQKIIELRQHFEGLRTITEVTADVREGLQSINASIVDSVKGMIDGTQKIGDAFKNLGNAIVSGFLNTIFRAAFRPAEGALEGAISKLGISIAGSLFGGGDGGGYTSIEQRYPATPRAASGGITRGPTIAGEAGPEAIIPLDQYSGGGTTVQILDQRGSGAPIKTQQSRGPDGRALIRVLVRDELNAVLGDGGADRSFGGAFGLSRVGTRR